MAGALKGGCKDGTMEGVMKIIFDVGCVRSYLSENVEYGSTNGRND